MITFFINRLISQKQEIKVLTNGTKSLQSIIKVALKSLTSRLQFDSEISLSLYSFVIQDDNQLRAPPVYFLPSPQAV